MATDRERLMEFIESYEDPSDYSYHKGIFIETTNDVSWLIVASVGTDGGDVSVCAAPFTDELATEIMKSIDEDLAIWPDLSPSEKLERVESPLWGHFRFSNSFWG